MLLLEIRRMVVDSLDQDEAVATLAIAKMIAGEFTAQQIPQPDWLSERVQDLEREVKLRRRDYLMRALAQAKTKRESFKSREQKLTDVNDSIANIEAELNKL